MSWSHPAMIIMRCYKWTCPSWTILWKHTKPSAFTTISDQSESAGSWTLPRGKQGGVCPYISHSLSSPSLWRQQMETFSALLALCAGNSLVTGEFPSRRPVTRSFDVFFDLRLIKWLSKQTRSRWSETPSRSLWRHCNEARRVLYYSYISIIHCWMWNSHTFRIKTALSMT